MPDAILAVAWRDLRAGLTSPLAWVVAAVWAMVTGIAFLLPLHQVHGTAGAAEPLLGTALRIAQLLLILLVPALTMGAFVQERQQRTLTLLLSLPVAPWTLVVGKWLAAMGMVALLLAVLAVQPVVLAFVSQAQPAHLAAAGLGLLLTASVAAALGVWTSLLAESALTAFVLAVGALAVWALIGAGADPEGGWWARTAAAIGLMPRLGGMLAGRVELGDATMAVGLTAGLLALAGAGVAALRQGARRVPWAAAGMLLVVIVMAVAAADRAGLTWDASPDRRFAVHPLLAEQAAANREPVELVALWERPLDRPAAPLLDGLRATAAVGRRMTVRRIDPVADAGALGELERAVGPLPAPAIVVRSGSHAVAIPVDGATRTVLQRELAGALATLADQRPRWALLAGGHGELHGDGGAADGVSRLATVLRTAGFQVARTPGAIPPDALLVVAGPTASIGAGDLARWDTHLRDGGGLLLLADDRAPFDLGRWLEQRQVILPQGDGDRRIVRHLLTHDVGAERGAPHHRLRLGGAEVISQHPVARGSAASGLELLLPWATPMGRDSATGAVRASALDPLLRPRPGDAWVARREDRTIPDPLPAAVPVELGIAAEYPATGSLSGRGGRLVVLGSRQMASDAVLADGRWANGRLLADAARWAARREGVAAIPPAELAAWQVLCSDRTLIAITFLIAGVIPIGLLAPAMLAWWDRRQGR